MVIYLIDDLNRAGGLIMLIIITILSYYNNLSLLYIIKYLLNIQINHFLKYVIFKPLMGDNNFYIIGTGIRPKGAMNCGKFRDNFFNKNIQSTLSKSYGFPSGHSQSSGFFATFIYENFKNNPYILYPFILYSLYIPYTRIQLGCHTVQQVIIGFLYGVIFYYIIENIHKGLNNFIYYYKNRKEINKKKKILNNSVINNNTSDSNFINV